METHFNPKKFYYFTSIAGQHLKNKSSFANLQALEEDFAIPQDDTSMVHLMYSLVPESEKCRPVLSKNITKSWKSITIRNSELNFYAMYVFLEVSIR